MQLDLHRRFQAYKLDSIDQTSNQDFAAEIAAEIAETYNEKLPLKPELRRVGWKTNDPEAAFMVINVLAPNAAKRKKYKR